MRATPAALVDGLTKRLHWQSKFAMTFTINSENGHSNEVRRGQRFRFGANWNRFLKVLNDERIVEAEKSLREYLEVASLEGKTFLDIGSGSGLFSLVARRLGAKVYSFDYDPESVACTLELKRRYFPGDDQWDVECGSVLDHSYTDSLGQFDIVYSWGVLHHTGDMWTALESVKKLVKPGGRLFIAIYNDTGKSSQIWLRIKKLYCTLPVYLRLPYAVCIWTPIELISFFRCLRIGKPGKYFDRFREYKKSRGMSRWHDMIDWIGGYPYEFAKAQDLVTLYTKDGFHLTKLQESQVNGNHQLVFTKDR